LNRCYCSENIKTVYQELFGEALKKYNAKQTRSDRRISNYYDKIRSGKQEKTACAGGLVGENGYNGTVTSCNASGEVSATPATYVGDLIGQNNGTAN